MAQYLVVRGWWWVHFHAGTRKKREAHMKLAIAKIGNTEPGERFNAARRRAMLA